MAKQGSVEYVRIMNRRKAQIEQALKPGDTIVIDGGNYHGMNAKYLDMKLLGREWMVRFMVETPQGIIRQHFGPIKILKILGIPDKD